jgi:hypothetical protein
MIMTKKSAYQKLKEENQKLKQDIYVLVCLKDSGKFGDVMLHHAITIKWERRFQLENKIWEGTRG